MRKEDERDAKGVAEARHCSTPLMRGSRRIGNQEWPGETLTLADCAPLPALFYADWVHPIADRFFKVRAYRAGSRSSFHRAPVDEARLSPAVSIGGA